jgi:GntR family transcriptional regulator
MPPAQYPHQRVTDHLRRRIRDGEFPPGAKLPSRRELCKEYGVSDTVVGRVMLTLAQEGLTESLVGYGTFVKGS